MNFQFLEVFQPVESVVPYQGTYEPKLVILSILIAVLASAIPLTVSSRVAGADSGKGRWAWASAGAVSMGGGIWAMHFIGMLAFSLPCGVSYHPLGTVASMIPGVVASGIALKVIGHNDQLNWGRLLTGAVLIGGGIGAMHYSGMAAMLPDADLRYSPLLVGVSVIVAVGLAAAALWVQTLARQHSSSELQAAFTAAPIMGFAVAGMHYTAMQASLFYPISGWVAPPETALPVTTFAFLIAGVSGCLAVVVLIASVAGRQWEIATWLASEVELREKLEAETEAGRARLQAIFDAVVDAIVTIDMKGRIQQWSTGAQTIFGYRAEEVVGEDLIILMPEPHRSRHSGYVENFLRTGAAKIIGVGREMTAIRKDGTEFPIELTVSEVRHGDEIFFTGILRDITERKRIEADLVKAREDAEAANLAKSQFLATMSHEIRTPMNGVLGMANLLSATPLNDRQEHLVGNVTRSGEALLGIINNILDFAKIEAGKFELSEIPFDLRETINDLTDLFAESCDAKGVELVYYVDEGLPSKLIGDPARLRQALVNLVGNATKFTEHGQILVEVSMGRRTGGGLIVEFVVEDTGIGIPPEQVSRIFESFHQVDGSLSRARGGSGLGLAITQVLIELMGGTISVESEFGRGSRFAFTICFREVSEDAESVSARCGFGRSLRVLLADANAVSAHVISLYLSQWGVDVDAVDGLDEVEEALRPDAGQDGSYDAAILDAKGFGDAAIELVQRIGDATPPISTRFVLLVGLDRYSTDESLNDLGVASILPRPVGASALYNALASSFAARDPKGCGKRNKAPTDRAMFDARVLVAEDNIVNQEVAIGILEAMGCKVVTAPDGRAAVHLFTEETFDAVLMDCEMPIMDGLEATRRIREIEEMEGALEDTPSRNGHTPVIAVTAHALNEIRDRCLAAGMDDFLTKPFDDRQMEEMLLRWLKPSGARTAISGPAEEIRTSEDNSADMDSRGQVLDLTVLDKLRSLDRPGKPSRFGRTVSKFSEIGPSLVAAIKDNQSKNDAESLWKSAHSLKSSAGALGAVRLSERCGQIEKLAQDARLDETRSLVDALENDLSAAIKELESAIGELKLAN